MKGPEGLIKSWPRAPENHLQRQRQQTGDGIHRDDEKCAPGQHAQRRIHMGAKPALTRHERAKQNHGAQREDPAGFAQFRDLEECRFHAGRDAAHGFGDRGIAQQCCRDHRHADQQRDHRLKATALDGAAPLGHFPAREEIAPGMAQGSETGAHGAGFRA